MNDAVIHLTVIDTSGNLLETMNLNYAPSGKDDDAIRYFLERQYGVGNFSYHFQEYFGLKQHELYFEGEQMCLFVDYPLMRHHPKEKTTKRKPKYYGIHKTRLNNFQSIYQKQMKESSDIMWEQLLTFGSAPLFGVGPAATLSVGADADFL